MNEVSGCKNLKIKLNFLKSAIIINENILFAGLIQRFQRKVKEE